MATTIYTVSTGEYSDHRVVAAYSDRATAERIQKLVCPENTVEELELDPDDPQLVKEGEGVWRVRMSAQFGYLNGSYQYMGSRPVDAYPIGYLESDCYKNKINVIEDNRPCRHSWEVALGTFVVAKSQEHAIKIGAELFAAHDARKAGIAL